MYYQIQTQLGACDRKWCDFVFYTQKGISVNRISFDNTLFQMIASKSNFFFNKYVIPALKKSTNEILKHNNLNFFLSFNFVFRFVNFYKNAKIYHNSNLWKKINTLNYSSKEIKKISHSLNKLSHIMLTVHYLISDKVNVKM